MPYRSFVARTAAKLSANPVDPMPTNIQPMLAAITAHLPVDEDAYHYEYKWDGIRAITYWDGREMHLCSRNDNEIRHRYPEFANIKGILGSRKIILDGEIIAVDEQHRPSFPLLQHRMHVQDP